MYVHANNLPRYFSSPQHKQIWYLARSHHLLMSLKKRRVSLCTPPSPNIWRETNWNGREKKEKRWKRIAGPTLISLSFESVWLALTGNETVVTAGEIFILGPPSTLAKQSLFIIHIKHPCISHWPAGVYWLVVIVLHTNFHTGSGGFYFTGKNGKTTKQTFPCSGETIYFKTEALIHPEIDAFRLRCVQVLVLSWSVLALFFRLWPRVGFHTGAPSENCGGTSDLLCSDWETQRLCV